MDEYKNIFNHELLTAEEEYELGRRIRDEGDEEARNELFRCSARLVAWQAHKYLKKYRHMQFDDLVQEGMIGLWKATIKHDYRLGYRFSTYAVWWVRAYMNEASKKGMLENTVWDEEEMLEIADPTAESAFDAIEEKDLVRSIAEYAEELKNGHLVLQKAGLLDGVPKYFHEMWDDDGVKQGMIKLRHRQAIMRLQNQFL